MLRYGVTLDDFKSGVTRIRNRVIARIFRELDYIEEWSSGYKYCKENGYPIPKWQEFGSVIRAIFYPHEGIPEVPSFQPLPKNLTTQLSSRQLEILNILSQHGELHMREILTKLKVPPAERNSSG